MAKIFVKESEITILSINKNDYISLTDIARHKSDDPTSVISNWLRNRNTIEYLGMWETLFNPVFKPLEFEVFKNQAGLNAFTLSPQKWITSTGAIGIVTRPGRYGGTYAHKDIAFKFASWISVEFELYMVKELQRLKEREQAQIGWSAKRELAISFAFGIPGQSRDDIEKRSPAKCRGSGILSMSRMTNVEYRMGLFCIAGPVYVNDKHCICH